MFAEPSVLVDSSFQDDQELANILSCAAKVFSVTINVYKRSQITAKKYTSPKETDNSIKIRTQCNMPPNVWGESFNVRNIFAILKKTNQQSESLDD